MMNGAVIRSAFQTSGAATWKLRRPSKFDIKCPQWINSLSNALKITEAWA